MFLNRFPTILRQFEVKVFDEKYVLKNASETIFRRKLLLEMAVEWWEIDLETCSGYKKIPQSQGYTSVKKNQDHTTRRNENIAGKGRKG